MATRISVPEGQTVAHIQTANSDVLAYLERRGLLHLSSVTSANGLYVAQVNYDDSIETFLRTVEGESWLIEHTDPPFIETANV
jgi:hypothetical protein